MKIENIKIDLIKFNEKNPKQISDIEKRDLMESIKRFGVVDPIILNKADGRENVLIGGHQRVSVLKEMGYEEIPCVFVNISDIEKERELVLRLSKNTGHWDFDKLGKFDIETLLDVGFGDEDLSEIWDNVDTLDDDHNKEESANSIKETSIKTGDLYELGSHRLMCGDSTELEQVKKLVGDNKINMIYNHPFCEIEDDYFDFVEKTIVNALSVADNNVHVYYWCDEKSIGTIQTLFKNNDIQHKRVCMWIKNNFSPTPQVAFNKAYDPCVYGVIGRPYLNPKIKNFNEVLNKEILSGNQIQDEIGDIFNIWLAKNNGVDEINYPKQKPITLHEKPIKRTTRIGDNILDLFGGSGSTLMSAEQLGRKSFLMEIDPTFCQVIINRWEQHTNKKAKKII